MTFSHFVRFILCHPILTVDFHVTNRLWIAGSLEDSSSHATAAEGLEEGEVAAVIFDLYPPGTNHISFGKDENH